MGSLLVHAFHSSHSCFTSSQLSYFQCLSSQFSLFPTSLFLCVFSYSSLLLFTVHDQDLFILPAMIIFTILPLNYFSPVVGVLPRLPIGLLAA